jgi:hypothetical protein
MILKHVHYAICHNQWLSNNLEKMSDQCIEEYEEFINEMNTKYMLMFINKE